MPTASPRADAAANRALIIDVARAALDDDRDVTLSTIARRAGVGQGTLYRHFPTREDLLVAVYRTDVEALIAAAPRLLLRHPPLAAVRRWLEQLAAYGRVKQAVSAAVEVAISADLSSTYRPATEDAIEQLLAAGRASNEIRDDITPGDVILLSGFLWRMPSPYRRTQVAHLLDLLIDSLRSP